MFRSRGRGCTSRTARRRGRSGHLRYFHVLARELRKQDESVTDGGTCSGIYSDGPRSTKRGIPMTIPRILVLAAVGVIIGATVVVGITAAVSANTDRIQHYLLRLPLSQGRALQGRISSPTCRGSSNVISWNSVGPQGPQGPSNGLYADDSAGGSTATANSPVPGASLTLPPGSESRVPRSASVFPQEYEATCFVNGVRA